MRREASVTWGVRCAVQRKKVVEMVARGEWNKREFKVSGERNALCVIASRRTDRRANWNWELEWIGEWRAQFLELRMEQNAIGVMYFVRVLDWFVRYRQILNIASSFSLKKINNNFFHSLNVVLLGRSERSSTFECRSIFKCIEYAFKIYSFCQLLYCFLSISKCWLI